MYRFLTLEEIVAEQERQLSNYGGGFPGIINRSTLESACYASQHSFGGEYLHEDAFAMAAASLVGFVKGHAFANGNKRIGLAAALEFLYLNALVIEASNDEVVALVLDVIAGTTSAALAAAFFKSHAQPLQADGDASLAAATVWVHGKYAEAFKVLAL